MFTGEVDLNGRIDVADEQGSVIATIPFSDAVRIKGAAASQTGAN